MKNEMKTGAGPIPDSPTVYRRKKIHRNNSNKAKQNDFVFIFSLLLSDYKKKNLSRSWKTYCQVAGTMCFT